MLSLIRQSRSGKLNDANFHSRFKGAGPYAELLGQRFTRAARQLGLDTERPPLDLALFAVPAAPQQEKQLALF